jgi:hypothetical protein
MTRGAKVSALSCLLALCAGSVSAANPEGGCCYAAGLDAKDANSKKEMDARCVGDLECAGNFCGEEEGEQNHCCAKPCKGDNDCEPDLCRRNGEYSEQLL